MATYRYRLPRLLLDSNIAIPSIQCNKTTTSSYHEHSSFDTNMVIILAAFLCALVCALGLNSIVGCALRCRDSRSARDASNEMAASLASGRLEKEALSRIPVEVYEAGGDVVRAMDCPICLGEFVEGEDVRVLPRCNHGFHVKCVDRWLVLHFSCPTCRQPLMQHCNEVDVRVLS